MARPTVSGGAVGSSTIWPLSCGSAAALVEIDGMIVSDTIHLGVRMWLLALLEQLLGREGDEADRAGGIDGLVG